MWDSEFLINCSWFCTIFNKYKSWKNNNTRKSLQGWVNKFKPYEIHAFDLFLKKINNYIVALNAYKCFARSLKKLEFGDIKNSLY